MAKNNRRRANWAVTFLVVALSAFCVLSSIQEKYGLDFGLPALRFQTRLLDALIGASAGEGSVPVSASLRDTLEVHQIDVGQAESILIIGPQKSALIDAGENGEEERLLKYLREQKITSIDILIGTHPHSDHIGGMDQIIQEFDIGEVILPQIPGDIIPSSRAFTDLLLAIGDKGLAITPASPGDRYSLGGGATLAILAPLNDYSDLNNHSVVARLTYGSTSFLFTGDASKESEKDILDSGAAIRSDVLSLGHHGSGTSTTKAFLQAVSPSVALISCGMDNSYGHPHREVMERLREIGARILRTDLNGTIVLISDGESIGVEVEKNG